MHISSQTYVPGRRDPAHEPNVACDDACLPTRYDYECVNDVPSLVSQRVLRQRADLVLPFERLVAFESGFTRPACSMELPFDLDSCFNEAQE